MRRILTLCFLTTVACLFAQNILAEEASTDSLAKPVTVYKSPTCGCCKVWIRHIEDSGIETITEEPDDLNGLKTRLGISPRVRSCHTAVTADGYVFEGHIPAKLIKAFLANPPDNALGLTVPGMPVGSPGMESGDRFMPYQVIQMNRDGSLEVYASIATAADQY